MKRKIVAACMALCAVLVLEACASSKPVVFNESIPESETTRLFFIYGINITSYNGIDLPQQKQFLAPDISTWRDMILPAGDMEFGLNIWAKYGDIIYTAKDVMFKYKFEPGKYYTIDFITKGGPDKDKWGAVIYDQPPGRLKKQNLVAFAPFYKNGQ